MSKSLSALDALFANLPTPKAPTPNVGKLAAWLDEVGHANCCDAQALADFIGKGCAGCATVPEDDAAFHINPVDVVFLNAKGDVFALCTECLWAKEGCHESGPGHSECPLVASNVLHL